MSCPEDLVAHMRRVLLAERDLHDLGVMWRLIESSAAISCPREVAPILPTLVGTRQRFDAMQDRLIAQMAAESQAQLADDLGAKARSAIDILVRNLYERTADVGFLATDDAVRQFCAAPPAQRDALRQGLRERLAEYQRKYSVYDDILLCTPEGRVLLRLADESAQDTTGDPVVAQAAAAPGYVERFGASDLAAPGAPAALRYAHRITSAQGGLLGVLVLRFRFADEMARLFADVASDRHPVAVMLLDPDGRVIATNDEAHVPLGVRLPCDPDAGVQLLTFAGREYLGLSCRGTPYQGYPGPQGWRAVAMVSLLTAFSARQEAAADEDTQATLAQAELLAIRDDADAINRDLRRVVWNGRLMAHGAQDDHLRLTAVLSQVAEAGVRTRARVERAIRDIGLTALARGRQRARELGRLMADILDRNLYERANDARWWALSPVLRQALAAPVDAAGRTAMAAVLNHINGLYTVYSRLVVFDAQGGVQAFSGEAPPGGLAGQTVPEAMRRQVLGLASSQDYAVTDFADSLWHDQGPTYTYLAAVRDPADERRIVGGIALVFNAARELQAILRDILGERAGLAAFVDAQGRVLAQAGTLAAEPALTAFEGELALVDHGQMQMLCARVKGRGYREFRQVDGYDHGVRAVVGLVLGPAERRRSRFSDAALTPPSAVVQQPATELAFFQVGAGCYALPSAALLEARAQQGLVSPPGAPGALVGLLEVGHPEGTRLVHVMCARRLFGILHAPRAGDGMVLVLRHPRQPAQTVLGFRVDDVLSVSNVAHGDLHPAPDGVQAFAPWVTHLVKCRTAGGDMVLVQVLAPDVLLQQAGLDLPAGAGTEPLPVAPAAAPREWAGV